MSDDVQGGAIGAPFGRGREATEAAEASSGSPRRVSWVHGRCAELAVQCVRAGGSAETRRCVNAVHHWCTNGLVCAACQGGQMGGAHRFEVAGDTARTTSTNPARWRRPRRSRSHGGQSRRRPAV